jgi:predicted esterase
MTSTERDAEIRDYVRYLDRVARTVEGTGHVSQGTDQRKKRSPQGIGRPLRRLVFGFSQGVHTASRWAVLGRTRIHTLVLWGASLPPDLPARAADRLKDARVVLVRGEEDTLRKPEEEARDEAWLKASGIQIRILTHPGGHEVVPALLEEIEDGLEGGVA